MTLFLLWIYKLGHKWSFGPCKQTQWHSFMTHPPVTSKAWAWHGPDHLFCLLETGSSDMAVRTSCKSPALCRPGRVDLRRWGTESESKENSCLCWERKRCSFGKRNGSLDNQLIKRVLRARCLEYRKGWELGGKTKLRKHCLNQHKEQNIQHNDCWGKSGILW